MTPERRVLKLNPPVCPKRGRSGQSWSSGEKPGTGTIVPFPVPRAGSFGAEIRCGLSWFAARTPGIRPLSFGEAADGSEFCHLGNGLTVAWNRNGDLVLTDTFSGYVDHGPFDSLDDVCSIIEYVLA